MKRILLLILLASTVVAYADNGPVYLDETKPLEERVEDALSRMTLKEKIGDKTQRINCIKSKVWDEPNI